MNKQYYTGPYANDHWALQPYTLEDPNVIALVKYNDAYHYAVYLNPTDKRGYRSIVRYLKKDDEALAINRDYTKEELRGLALVTEMMERVYGNYVVITQIFKAGNNSHSFNPETRTVLLGNAREPNFLHNHIIGRGDPECEYIKGVKLNGPMVGLNFDMMGKTATEVGNERKIPWNADGSEMNAVRLALEIGISKYADEYADELYTSYQH